VVPQAAQATISSIRATLMPSTQAVQAVSKSYVDSAIAALAAETLPLEGGTMTGPLILSEDPTEPLEAADKHYVDEEFADALPLTGGTMTGALILSGDPTQALQASDKKYVDAQTTSAAGGALRADQFAGANFGAKLQACVNALNSSYGGTCDARNFTGAQTMSSNLTISTANATVLLPCATITSAYQIVVPAGVRNVTLKGCGLRGGSSTSGTLGGTVIAYTGSAAAILVGDSTYAKDTPGFHLDDVVINTTGSSSALAKAMIAYRTQELDVKSVYLQGNSNQTAITLDGTGNYTGGTLQENQIVGYQVGLSAIGHQTTNSASTDWMNASSIIRLHVACPTSSNSPISGTIGIDLEAGDGNTFTGGDVEGCDEALHLGSSAKNNTIIGLRNENSNSQVVADSGSAYNNWISGGTIYTGELTDNGTRNSFTDTFHRSFNGLNGDWYGSQQDATVTDHQRLGTGLGNERGRETEIQTDYGYRWTSGYSDGTTGLQLYHVNDQLNGVDRLSIGQYLSSSSGVVSNVVINNGGCFSSSTAPAVTFSGGSATTAATAKANMVSSSCTGGYTIGSITVSAGGAGYVSQPTVSVDTINQTSAPKLIAEIVAQGSTNNQTVLNSAGTGAVVLNGSANAGTGGVVIGSGGSSPTTVATISNAGNAQLTGTLTVNGTSVFNGSTTVRNNVDAEIDQFLWAGSTANQKESFVYKDYAGTSQWYMVKDASNNWSLNSAVGGLDSFKAYQSTNSGDTYVDASKSTGVVRVNYESGSGTAFNIYGGSSSALYASFLGTSAIKFPGIASSTGRYCLQIDSSGYISNTGSTCGTGNTDGTVNTGTQGQIAYYTGAGTAIAGEASVPASAGGTALDTSSSTGVAQVSSGTWNVSTALPSGTTATTQPSGNNSTKVATTAYVDSRLVPVISGGTGGTTAASGLANLGGVSATSTTTQTMAGALNLPTLEGETFADQAQSGSGNNGIANALSGCNSLTTPCNVTAPATYAQTESQPWGGMQSLPNNPYPTTGPKSTDPIGTVLDYRWGAPQWTVNQGEVNSSSPTRFAGTSPSFVMNVTSAGSGSSPHSPSALFTGYKVLSGTRDFRSDETYSFGQEAISDCYSSGVCSSHRGVTNNYGTGDTISLYEGATSYGQRLSENEGIEIRSRLLESGNLPAGTLGTPSCSSTGPCSMPVTQTQGISGTFGSDTPLIDVTNGYNTGYVASIGQQAVSTGVGGATITGSSGTNWDSVFGTTTALTTTTQKVSASLYTTVNGGTKTHAETSGSGNTTETSESDDTTRTSESYENSRSTAVNSFPLSSGGVVVSVASSSGFSSGQTACIFDSYDTSWQCARVTATGTGTITLDEVYYPINSGSVIAAGGMTGYAMGMDADVVSTSGTNGYGTNDSGINGTIRPVYPVIENLAGNVALLYNPNSVGAPTISINTRAYRAMGSGGTAAVTVSGGAVTSCTVTGGTGYTSKYYPPQLTISGITYTTAPLIYVSGVSSGVLSACSVASAGSGISGTPVVTVTPTNGYHIYPQATILNVYNAATGKLDGSGITTTPLVGTFAKGDTVENQHYFRMKSSGFNQQMGTWQMGGQRFGMLMMNGGSFGDNDYEALFQNTNNSYVYMNYPLGTPYNVGQGQLNTPNGLALTGAHRNGLMMYLPPFSYANKMGAVYVGCGSTAECAAWGYYNMLTAGNSGGGEDVLQYSPSSKGWNLTAGGTGTSGTNAGCGFQFTASGLTITGSGCAITVGGTKLNASTDETDTSTVLSGDVTGTLAATVVEQLNGGSIPASAKVIGTNASGQLVDATSATLSNNTTGNAATATALAEIPDSCVTGKFATGITAAGTANCAQVSYTQLAGTVPTWNQNTTGTAAGLSTASTLPDGTTATTRMAGDNSTKVATTAYAETVGTNVPGWLRYLGDGSDGANTSASGTMAGEYYYTNFTVPYGNTVTIGAVNGGRGLIIHATGTCTIAGTITASGVGVIGTAWLGGFGGGGGGGTAAGSAGSFLYQSYAGGSTVSGGVADGGAGSSASGWPTTSAIRAAINGGLGFDLFNAGGSTGGQGGSSGGAGGKGGAQVVLICGSIVGTDGTNTGSITANGAAGTAASANNTGAGGGGGGGILVLSSQAAVSTWPTLSVTGGSGGSCGSYTGCGAGGTGSAGWTAKFNNW
jgi:hypothetical protein